MSTEASVFVRLISQKPAAPQGLKSGFFVLTLEKGDSGTGFGAIAIFGADLAKAMLQSKRRNIHAAIFSPDMRLDSPLLPSSL